MAGLMSPSRMRVAGIVVFMLAWPGYAQAGWFVSDNQVAYRLSQRGHDHQALHYWDASAEGWYGKGTALMHLGRMREAEQAFRASLEVAPHKTGFSDRLEMPLDRRPKFMASVWYNLGNSLYAQGELAEARQAWLKTLSYQPGHAKARHNLDIVDKLLGAGREQEQSNPAGLTGGKEKRPKKQVGNQSGDAQQQNGQRQEHQHAPLPLHMPGESQHASTSTSAKHGAKNGNAHTSAGAGEKSQRPTGRRGPHRLAKAGSHAPVPGGGEKQVNRPVDDKGISAQQAVQELRMVEEGVSVFLRHRLSEKTRGNSAGEAGEPW